MRDKQGEYNNKTAHAVTSVHTVLHAGRGTRAFVQHFHHDFSPRGGLAQWRSRGNDVFEALAEVDAPAVEGGELLDRVRVRVKVRVRVRMRVRVRATARSKGQGQG